MKTIEKLQFITNGANVKSIVHEVTSFLEGGGRWVQLRMKRASDGDIIEVAKEIKPICKQYRAKFIVNDCPEIAMMVEADGVHLGKNDMSISEARMLLGPNKIIGGTANNMQDIERIISQKANYIGLGPFRFTTTKENLSPILGLDGYKNIVEEMDRLGFVIPVVGIGGIGLGDVPGLLETGLYGVAISSSISNSSDPQQITKSILSIFNYYQQMKETEILTQINTDETTNYRGKGI